MFRGIKPQGQERSLRSIVEKENNPGAFPPPAPLPEDEWAGTYHDAAEAALPVGDGRRQQSPADPQPFKNVRGGK